MEPYPEGSVESEARMAQALPSPALPTHPGPRTLKIGQLALRTGTSSRNLRFYADAGVFGELSRSPKGYRLFPAEAIQWVRVLQVAQAAGFTLGEIQDLIRALRADGAPCVQVRDVLGGKLQALEVRLVEIQLLVEVLKITLQTPDGQTSDLGCNLVSTLLAESTRLPAQRVHRA